MVGVTRRGRILVVLARGRTQKDRLRERQGHALELIHHGHRALRELRPALRPLHLVALEVVERRELRHAVLARGNHQDVGTYDVEQQRPELVLEDLALSLGERRSLGEVAGEVIGRVLDAFVVLAGRRAQAVREPDDLGERPELVLHRDGPRREESRLRLVALEMVENDLGTGAVRAASQECRGHRAGRTRDASWGSHAPRLEDRVAARGRCRLCPGEPAVAGSVVDEVTHARHSEDRDQQHGQQHAPL